MSERLAVLERAIGRARAIRGTVRLLDGDDEVAFVQASVRGELRLSVDAPVKRWFFDPRKGLRWLQKNGFRGDQEALTYEPPRERTDAQVAQLLDDAIHHGLGRRGDLAGYELPGGAPGVAPEADDAEHLAAALLVIVRAGAGSVSAHSRDRSAHAAIEDGALRFGDRTFPATESTEVAALMAAALPAGGPLYLETRAEAPSPDFTADPERVLFIERAIERAREIHGMVVVMRQDDTAAIHAAVRGELRITIDDPGGNGRRWLLQRGFGGDEMLEYEPPHERTGTEIATLLAGAFEHGLGVRATAPLEMYEYPGALPEVPLPPPEADYAIHLRAALLGPVKYGVGDVTVTCGDTSAYAWVEDDALWLDERPFARDADGIREVADLISARLPGDAPVFLEVTDEPRPSESSSDAPQLEVDPVFEEAVARARAIRGSVSLGTDPPDPEFPPITSVCDVQASIGGDIHLTLWKLPSGGLFNRHDAELGCQWLADHGFTLDEDTGSQRFPRSWGDGDLAYFLADMFQTAYGRDRMYIDGERPLALDPDLPLPPPDAEPVEHVAAMLTGLVRAGAGTGWIDPPSVPRWMPMADVDDGELTVKGQNDVVVATFAADESSVPEAARTMWQLAQRQDRTEADPLFISVFGE